MCFFILRKVVSRLHWEILRRAPLNTVCWCFCRKYRLHRTNYRFKLFYCQFFAGRLPLCNKYDLVDLQYQVRQRNGRHLPPPSRQFPQLAVCEELVAFYSDLSHNLDEGLNCLHFHRLKQEELCILLRGYYSLEDLYILLKSVIGSSDNFKDFVLENYQHVNDVSDLRCWLI